MKKLLVPLVLFVLCTACRDDLEFNSTTKFINELTSADWKFVSSTSVIENLTTEEQADTVISQVQRVRTSNRIQGQNLESSDISHDLKNNALLEQTLTTIEESYNRTLKFSQNGEFEFNTDIHNISLTTNYSDPDTSFTTFSEYNVDPVTVQDKGIYYIGTDSDGTTNIKLNTDIGRQRIRIENDELHFFYVDITNRKSEVNGITTTTYQKQETLTVYKK